MPDCPCGTERALEDCCGPYLEGTQLPSTAEELMRSRYSAYALANFEYVRQTWHPDHSDKVPEQLPQVEWLGLTVEETESGQPDDEQGVVQFVARFESQGREQMMRERSLFQKQGGRWYYTQAAPLRAQSTKVGRNEPCPCGSGRKFKKCCGR